MSRESGRKTTGETLISSTTDKFVVYASNVTWRVWRFCLGTHGDSCPLNIATRCVIEMDIYEGDKFHNEKVRTLCPNSGP